MNHLEVELRRTYPKLSPLLPTYQLTKPLLSIPYFHDSKHAYKSFHSEPMNDDCGTLGRSSLPSSFGCFRWVLQIGGLALPYISIFSFIPGMTWTQIRLMTADDSFYLIQLPWHVFPYSPIDSYLVASQSSTWRLMGRVSCRTLASLLLPLRPGPSPIYSTRPGPVERLRAIWATLSPAKRNLCNSEKKNKIS